LPIDLHQTINTAQLFAAVQALSATSSTKVAICTDSSYVYGGAMGSARRWKVRGRRNSTGAFVPNITLWEALIVDFEKQDRVVK